MRPDEPEELFLSCQVIQLILLNVNVFFWLIAFIVQCLLKGVLLKRGGSTIFFSKCLMLSD